MSFEEALANLKGSINNISQECFASLCVASSYLLYVIE